MTLKELVFLSSQELNELARKAKIKGRGSLSKAEKIIALCSDELSDEDKRVIAMDSKELYDLCKESGIKNYSKLSQAEKILALVGEKEPIKAEGPGLVPTTDDAYEREKARAFELAQISANRLNLTYAVYENTNPKEVPNLFYIQSAEYAPPPMARFVTEIEPNHG